MASSSPIDLASSWDEEYGDRGIPSSWKEHPSTVVVWALESLPRIGKELEHDELVLDVGCGTGRNTIAVANRCGCRALGFDYSEVAIARAKERLNEADNDLAARVEFQVQDMRSPLSTPDSTVSLAMDIFVYFHLLSSDDRARYRAELARALRNDGLLLLSLATDDDGYYGSCPQQNDWRGKSGVPVVLDRHAGVGNIMHSIPSLLDEMSDRFELAMAWRKVATGPMHNDTYRRVTLATLWKVKN